MSLELLEAPTTQQTDNGGENHFAHYAEAEKVTEAYVMGTPIEALCGKLFVPHRDPKKFPVCPICQEILNSLFLDHEE